MSHKEQLKIIQMGPEAEAIVKAGFEAGKSRRLIDMDLRKKFGYGASEGAIQRYKERVLDHGLDIIKTAIGVKDLIMKCAPDDLKGDATVTFNWLQNVLNGIAKSKVAEILLDTKGIDKELLLKYADASERRALENRNLDIKEKQLDNDKQLLVVRLQEAEAKKAAAEARLRQIESLTETKEPMNAEQAARKLREIHGLAKK